MFRSKPFPEKLVKEVRNIKHFLVVDEQTPSGDLSSCVYEGFREKKFFPIINSKSLPERYFFENGGREYLLNKFGLSSKDIFLAAKSLR